MTSDLACGTQMTLRDDVWDAALTEIVENGTFAIKDLEFEKSQRHTVRRVLGEMEALGWLSRTDSEKRTWQLGQKAEMRLNVSAELVKEVCN